jgi:methanogenic corrinoid protein MtbC1
VANTIAALLALDGISLRQIIADSALPTLRFAEEILVPALDQLGERWQQGELSLSQIYMSGRFCERLLDEATVAGAIPQWPTPPMAVAVLEDFHVLGKRLLCGVLKASGYRFHDYGPISAADLVRRVQEDGIRILLISTLMLNSALRIAQVREQLAAVGQSVYLIVGGAPFRFDPQLATEVGADATSATATGVRKIIAAIPPEVLHAS